MSPTEKELRAFLREGEGDVPDAVSVISNAMRVREAHRKRLTTVLTSAAAVVVVVGGSVLLANAGGSNDESASGGGVAQSTNTSGGSVRSANSGASYAPKAGMNNEAGGIAPHSHASNLYNAMMGLPMCPSSPTHYALPGGGGLNSFGANGKMWKRTPNAMRICAYVGQAPPASRLAYGDQVAAIAQDLETASVTSVAGPSCPTAAPAAAGGTIEIYALDANRNKLKPVVVDVPACGALHATNGTASRYLPELPSELASTFAKAERRASPHR